MKKLRMMKGRTKLATIAATILLLASVTVAASQAIKNRALRLEVNKMSEETKSLAMKTMCVGRLLVDVPADAAVSFRTASVGGWTITPRPSETDEEFRARLASRESQLKSMRNTREQTSLERARSVNAGPVTGKIFVFGRQWTHGFEHGKRIDETAVAMEAHVRSGSMSFTFAAPILDDEDERELAQIVSQVRPREIDEVPSQPAFCFNSGMVLDPLTAKQSENVTMFVGLKGKPDVSIALSTYAGRTPPTTLLERNRIAEEEMDAEDRARFTSFNKGARTINRIVGEEVLEKVTEYNGATGHSFMWETNGNDKTSVLSPFVVFEMSTGHGQPGNPVKSSLSDAEALALWGKISSTIRLREHGPVALPSQEPAGAPRGTLTTSGSKCPASGWWQCTDGIDKVDVSGGRVQYLRAGQTVPQALLLPPATLWQKLRGEQPSFQSAIPSNWKLVDRRKKTRIAPSKLLALAGASPFSEPDEMPKEQPSALNQYASIPIGTESFSGAVCTASGWWECLEPSALDNTRWFSGGALLPPATMLVPLTVIEKMKGVPGFVRVAASWRFIRFADSETPVSTEDGATSAGSPGGHDKDGSAQSEGV